MELRGWAAVIGVVATASTASPSPAAERIDARAVAFVEGFFRASDTFDFPTLDGAFAPGAKIVLPNGSELDPAEYITRRRRAAPTAPPIREFSDFETIARGPVVIVGLSIRTQRGSDVGSTCETWVLERKGDRFRALRVHFSAITAPVR